MVGNSRKSSFVKHKSLFGRWVLFSSSRSGVLSLSTFIWVGSSTSSSSMIALKFALSLVDLEMTVTVVVVESLFLVETVAEAYAAVIY